MKIKNARIFPNLVSFVDGLSQMIRIPTIHYYLASIGAPERWYITCLRTSGFVAILLVTSPLSVLLVSTSAVRSVIVTLCLVKMLSNVLYSSAIAYWNVYFAEVVNMGLSHVLLIVALSSPCYDVPTSSRPATRPFRIAAPLGIFTGALCSVAFSEVDMDLNGFKINALNISGIFSALLWLIASFAALVSDFSEEDNKIFSKGYLRLQTNVSAQDLSQEVHVDKAENLVEYLVGVFKSLVSLCGQTSFFILYFNYLISSSAHILLILMIIILPRDFFSWDVYYACLPAIAYGIAGMISVVFVKFLTKFGSSSNNFLIIYGIMSTSVGLICCVIIPQGGFHGNVSYISFFLTIVLVNSGFTFLNEGVQRVITGLSSAYFQTFDTSHLVNIFIFPRIISSLITGIMLDYIVGYCTFLGISLLFGMVGFFIRWDEFRLK